MDRSWCFRRSIPIVRNRLQSAFGSQYAHIGVRRPARHRLNACPRRLSLSRKGSAAASRTNSRPGAEMPCSQREFIFQNLVHSHTKGFEEAGLRTHGGGYSWIVDKIREFVGRWFGIQESQNLGIFGGGEGFVRWRWAAADSRSEWGAALRPTLKPAR